MRTQWTIKGNRDTGSSCLCDRGLHQYLRNFRGGGGLNTPNPPPPSVRHCLEHEVSSSLSSFFGSLVTSNALAPKQATAFFFLTIFTIPFHSCLAFYETQSWPLALLSWWRAFVFSHSPDRSRPNALTLIGSFPDSALSWASRFHRNYAMLFMGL